MVDASRPVAGPIGIVRSIVRRSRRRRALLSLHGRGTLARDLVIGANARFLSSGSVQIDRDVYIGRDFFCESDITVGPKVLISSRVAFIGDDHPFDDSALAVTDHKRRPAAHAIVEGDNLIGHGTILLGSITVGRGAIVGAGSLVTRDIPPDTICIGRPARPIGRRRGAPPAGSA